MIKVITIFALTLITFSCFAQDNKRSQASTELIKGLEKTETAKEAKGLVQHKIYQYVNRDLMIRSAYIMAIASQKLNYKKDVYVIDLNIKKPAISVGVKYDF